MNTKYRLRWYRTMNGWYFEPGVLGSVLTASPYLFARYLRFEREFNQLNGKG